MDGNGGSSTAVATINIAAVNDDPNAVLDSYTIDNFSVLTVTMADGVLANDTDTDSENLTVATTPAMDVSNGILELNADGSFVYTPQAGFVGEDMFVYMVMDDDGGIAAGVVELTIEAPGPAGIVDAVFAQPTDDDGETDSDVNLIDLVFGQA